MYVWNVEEFLVKIFISTNKKIFWFWIVPASTYTDDRIGTIEISVIYQLCSEQHQIVGVHELAKIKYILLRHTTLLDVKNQRKEQTQEKKKLQIQSCSFKISIKSVS